MDNILPTEAEKVPSKQRPNPKNVAAPNSISVNCGQKSVTMPNNPKAPPKYT